MGGHTVLPLPMGSHGEPGLPLQKEALYELEGCIVTWSHQISAFLRTDPSMLLDTNVGAGTTEQLDFWKAKLNNLNHIMTQLGDAKIKKILYLLKSASSTYLPAFERLIEATKEGHKEASELVPHLTILEVYLGILSASDDFTQIEELLRPNPLTLTLIRT